MTNYLSTLDVPPTKTTDRLFDAMQHAGIETATFFEDSSYDSHPHRFMPTHFAEEIFAANPDLYCIHMFGDKSYHTMTKEEVGL